VAFLDDAGGVDSAFQRIYGTSVTDAVREFQQDLRLGIWIPR
jgi:peptidoglycan hydrolase-like protein with peptidoglycan-binding domain